MPTTANAPAPKGKLCHAGQLLHLGCRVEPSAWKRTCIACTTRFSNEDLKLPAARCRFLTEHVGNFSPSRSFYVRWTVAMAGRTCEVDVKSYRLIHSNNVLLIFVKEEDAKLMSKHIPQLQPIDGSEVALRPCAQAKTLCRRRRG